MVRDHVTSIIMWLLSAHYGHMRFCCHFYGEYARRIFKPCLQAYVHYVCSGYARVHSISRVLVKYDLSRRNYPSEFL